MQLDLEQKQSQLADMLSKEALTKDVLDQHVERIRDDADSVKLLASSPYDEIAKKYFYEGMQVT